MLIPSGKEQTRRVGVDVERKGTEQENCEPEGLEPSHLFLLCLEMCLEGDSTMGCESFRDFSIPLLWIPPPPTSLQS